MKSKNRKRQLLFRSRKSWSCLKSKRKSKRLKRKRKWKKAFCYSSSSCTWISCRTSKLLKKIFSKCRN